MVIAAVLFDLDDTLFAQQQWLDGAWAAVAAAAPPAVSPDALLDALHAVAAEGSDRGRIIDRALALVGAGGADVDGLVSVFRAHAPAALTPYPGVVDGLRLLRRRVPIGLVTDGHPGIQRAKLAALGLADAFDTVVLSDELGREFRKPNPAPFLAAVARLAVAACACVVVGDRPDKDVAGARAAGLAGTVRVRTGEYARVADGPGCLGSVPTVADAFTWLRPRVAKAVKGSATRQRNVACR